MALSSLYYYKEKNRFFQEKKVKNRLAYSECQRLKKILGTNDDCEMKLIGDIKELENTYVEIAFAFALSLLFILPTGYFLALVSLRPMRKSIDTIDSFINGIVHDMNTPLSTIKLNAQLMQLQLKQEHLKEYSSRILQGISDVESLEEQLLFSLKAERYILKRNRFDLYELLKSRLKSWNDVRENIHVNLKGSHLHVDADAQIIKRMIDNIVLNAIKFSPRNSKVDVTLEEETLVVEDSGVGIKNTKEVFMKYYQEDQNAKGLGLGLFIVQSIASLHNLNITVESTLNIGTRFVINLKNIKVA